MESEYYIQEYQVQITAANEWRATSAMVACLTGTPEEGAFLGFEEWWFRREPWLAPEYAALLRFDTAAGARVVRRRLEMLLDPEIEVEELVLWERA